MLLFRNSNFSDYKSNHEACLVRYVEVASLDIRDYTSPNGEWRYRDRNKPHPANDLNQSSVIYINLESIPGHLIPFVRSTENGSDHSHYYFDRELTPNNTYLLTENEKFEKFSEKSKIEQCT